MLRLNFQQMLLTGKELANPEQISTLFSELGFRTLGSRIQHLFGVAAATSGAATVAAPVIPEVDLKRVNIVVAT